MKPVEVRSRLVDALRLDLVGPCNGSDLEAEVLTQAPSRWYLSGFLVLLEADPAQKIDDTSQDQFDFEGGDAEAGDDDTIPETPASRRAFFPSSIGLSLLVTETTDRVKVIVQWGDFRDEVLARLIELNRQRAEEERLSGAAAEAGGGKLRKKSTAGRKVARKNPDQPEFFES